MSFYTLGTARFIVRFKLNELEISMHVHNKNPIVN